MGSRGEPLVENDLAVLDKKLFVWGRVLLKGTPLTLPTTMSTSSAIRRFFDASASSLAPSNLEHGACAGHKRSPRSRRSTASGSLPCSGGPSAKSSPRTMTTESQKGAHPWLRQFQLDVYALFGCREEGEALAQEIGGKLVLLFYPAFSERSRSLDVSYIRTQWLCVAIAPPCSGWGNSARATRIR